MLLLTLRTGAVGLNLISANHVFMLEPSYKRTLVEQAIARSWRIGQTRCVTVYHMYTLGSVEQRVIEHNKRDVDGDASMTGLNDTTVSTRGDAATLPVSSVSSSSSSSSSKKRKKGGSNSKDMDMQLARQMFDNNFGTFLFSTSMEIEVEEEDPFYKVDPSAFGPT